jgi:hypothetical protein
LAGERAEESAGGKDAPYNADLRSILSCEQAEADMSGSPVMMMDATAVTTARNGASGRGLP